VANVAIQTCQFRDVQEMRVMQNELAFREPDQATALHTMIQVRIACLQAARTTGDRVAHHDSGENYCLFIVFGDKRACTSYNKIIPTHKINNSYTQNNSYKIIRSTKTLRSAWIRRA
jgi:hypothetical protein